jgi:hypothetical protein
MHQRCQHRDHHDHLVLDDLPELLHLGHRILELHLGVGYQSQHLPDEERRLGEGHQCEVHRPVLDERLRHRLVVERCPDVGHGPCPG